MELSMTGATGFFGSQIAQGRDGRDIRVNPVAPGPGPSSLRFGARSGSQRKPSTNGRSKPRQKYH